ncbi:YeeE/YedE family protein [Massilia sp. H6]|uniref:YeeE/YedE family protein n=1 Tax=Massilia sp. H6 TaxID=2970464 RepID=UPI002169E10C|nr:YeeE/YedE family protein [Massilia sp. H6]UVW26992.1 YeeE/YedE family protein [Massilia sp. H6]
MQIFMALIVGLVFGIGLLISGMADPAKVLNFLDLAGNWDPSLALVMGGAILVGVLAFRVAAGRNKSLLGEPMRLPTATNIDRRLVVGGLSFGVGWGLAGYCPGPALVSLVGGGEKPLIFTAALLAGMAIFELLERLPRATGEQRA